MTTPTTPASRDTDRAPIQRLLTQLSDAWNACNAEAYGNLFVDDASYVTFFGKILRGRTEIVNAHRWLFAQIPGTRMTPGTKTHQEITFLSPDVALIVGQGGRPTKPGQASGGDNASTVSFVAVHQPDGWRLAHFQNTHVTPMPEPNNGLDATPS